MLVRVGEATPFALSHRTHMRCSLAKHTHTHSVSVYVHVQCLHDVVERSTATPAADYVRHNNEDAEYGRVVRHQATFGDVR